MQLLMLLLPLLLLLLLLLLQLRDTHQGEGFNRGNDYYTNEIAPAATLV